MRKATEIFIKINTEIRTYEIFSFNIIFLSINSTDSRHEAFVFIINEIEKMSRDYNIIMVDILRSLGT